MEAAETLSSSAQTWGPDLRLLWYASDPRSAWISLTAETRRPLLLRVGELGQTFELILGCAGQDNLGVVGFVLVESNPEV